MTPQQANTLYELKGAKTAIDSIERYAADHFGIVGLFEAMQIPQFGKIHAIKAVRDLGQREVARLQEARDMAMQAIENARSAYQAACFGVMMAEQEATRLGMAGWEPILPQATSETPAPLGSDPDDVYDCARVLIERQGVAGAQEFVRYVGEAIQDYWSKGAAGTAKDAIHQLRTYDQTPFPVNSQDVDEVPF